MVQTTDLLRDYVPSGGRVNWTRNRAVLYHRQMPTGAVAVVPVRREDATQMGLVEDDQVIQTLPSERPDGSLDVRILAGRARRNSNLGYTHRFDPSAAE
jgi:hypothetical protein